MSTPNAGAGVQPTTGGEFSETPLYDHMASARLWPLAPNPTTPATSAAHINITPATPAGSEGTPVQGIDVSRWQGQIDWPKVRSAGYGFAYIKASEGNSTSYPTLDAQYQGACNAGMLVGLYHYAQPGLSPEANADALALQVGRLGAITGHLPPCLDLEEGSGHMSGWAQAFIKRLRERTGCRTVMVYSGSSFFQAQIGEGWMDPDVALWIAHYGRSPGQPAYLTPRVAIHQFSATGQVPGISGHVDLNQAIWPVPQLVIGGAATTAAPAPSPPTTTPSPVPAAPREESRGDTVNLSISSVLPAGEAVQAPVLVPPYDGHNARLRIATGWTDAVIKNIHFIRDKGPNLTPNQEQWGGTGPFVLVKDDRPWWELPEGTTQVSLEYDSAHPLGVLITYKPAAEL